MGLGVVEARQNVHVVRETCFRPDLITSVCSTHDLEIEVRAEGETAQQALANLNKGIQYECDSTRLNPDGKKKATVCEKLGQPMTLEMCGQTRGPFDQFFYDLNNFLNNVFYSD